MLKKITVLAMALGALAALALPSTAGAAWRHKDTGGIQQDLDFEVTGTNVRFQGSIRSLECQTKSTVTFFANQTTGVIHNFDAHPTSDTANCKLAGGLAFCQIHNQSPTGLEWSIHTVTEFDKNKIQITIGEIHNQATGAFCPAQAITLTGGFVLATPEQEPVQTLQLSGTLQAHVINGQSQQTETSRSKDNCTSLVPPTVHTTFRSRSKEVVDWGVKVGAPIQKAPVQMTAQNNGERSSRPMGEKRLRARRKSRAEVLNGRFLQSASLRPHAFDTLRFTGAIGSWGGELARVPKPLDSPA